MLIYNTQSIPCHVSQVTCRMLHVTWLLNTQLCFLPKLEYKIESSNLYWNTKKKRKTRTVSKKVIKVSRLFTISDLEKYTIS